MFQHEERKTLSLMLRSASHLEIPSRSACPKSGSEKDGGGLDEGSQKHLTD